MLAQSDQIKRRTMYSRHSVFSDVKPFKWNNKSGMIRRKNGFCQQTIITVIIIIKMGC